MLYIRLGDEDRERLGCPEWIEYDGDTFLLTEAEILDDHGIDWGVLRQGEPLVGEDGKPIMTAAGNEARRYKPRAQRVWIWSALRRAGRDVGFAELEVDLNRAQYRVDDPASPGKDSELSGPATSSSSPDSGDGPRKSRKPSHTTSS